LQPDSWGLTFCPAARAHEAQIRSIVGEQFSSGDWFVATKASACTKKLEDFFASIKSISYTKQATGLLKLEQSISKDGLNYAGFVGLDGKPNFVDDSVSGEVYGYSAALKQPVLLAAKIEAGRPLKEQAMPLSPLFALTTPCNEYLSKSGVIPDGDTFKDALPPLVEGLVRP